MIPYSKTVRVTVTGATDNVVELPAPVRGILNRLSIYQIGDSENFTARLFTAERAAGASENSLSDVDDESNLPDEAFAVTAALAGTGGKFEEYDSRQGYESNEWAQTGRRQSSLWLKLTPAVAGSKTFAIAYTILVPELT